MADFTTRFNELLARSPNNDTAIAEALGVSKQTISAWKNGNRFPKKPVIQTVAKYFGVSSLWLEGVSDDIHAGMDLSNNDKSSQVIVGKDKSFYFFFGESAASLKDVPKDAYDDAVKKLFINAIDEYLHTMNLDELQKTFQFIFRLKQENERQ